MGNLRAGQPVDLEFISRLAAGRVLQEQKHTDSTLRHYTNSWKQGMITPAITKRDSSNIEIHWRVPFRNDSTSWGGAYTEIFYSEDEGLTWTTIGSSGYTSGTMVSGGYAIEADNNTHLIEGLTGTSFKLKFMHKSFDGTSTENERNGMSGDFFSTVIVKEISGYGEL